MGWRLVLPQVLCAEDAQDLIEYSLLLAFLAIAAIALLSNTGTTFNGVFDGLDTAVNAAKAVLH